MMINWSVAELIILHIYNIDYQAVNTVLVVSALIPATACQLILFTTKLLPVVHQKIFPDEAQTTSVTNVTLPTAATTEDS